MEFFRQAKTHFTLRRDNTIRSFLQYPDYTSISVYLGTSLRCCRLYAFIQTRSFILGLIFDLARHRTLLSLYGSVLKRLVPSNLSKWWTSVVKTDSVTQNNRPLDFTRKQLIFYLTVWSRGSFSDLALLTPTKIRLKYLIKSVAIVQ